jgi:hypothetical protein
MLRPSGLGNGKAREERKTLGLSSFLLDGSGRMRRLA